MLLQKFIRNQRLIPVIATMQDKMLAEMRRWQLEEAIINCTQPGVAEEAVLDDKRLIVSLTSYGRRLYDVAYTVESIMRQTLKPNKIVLWIDESDKDNIPIALRNQQAR